MTGGSRRRDPARLGRFEKLGAWLGIWTPPRDSAVPPPPWRKLALCALGLLLAAAGVVAFAGPRIERGKEERSAEERRRAAGAEAARRRRLAREGRPRSGRGRRPAAALSPAQDLRARRVLVGDLERAITRDARGRVRAGELEGPVLLTECEINPPSRRRVERDPGARGSEYDCLAVTRRDPDGRFAVGYSFDASVDYRRFRFRWRKACLAPGEGAARLTC
jgi:hypothetical protein